MPYKRLIMEIGDKVLYDNEECIIMQIFIQENASPSGDVLLMGSDGIEFLVHRSELG